MIVDLASDVAEGWRSRALCGLFSILRLIRVLPSSWAFKDA
jgi:hypothetical protein